MNNLRLRLFAAVFLGAFTVTGCASLESAATTASTDLQKVGYWAANLLQTKNDGGTTLATQLGSIATSVLNVVDPNAQKAPQEVAVVTSLVNAASAAVVTAKAQGATPAQTQAAVNTVLSPAAVNQTVAAVAAVTPAS